MTPYPTFVILFCVLWITPFAAEAAETAVKTQNWWQALLMPLFSLLGTVIVTFASYGILKLVKLVENKWKIDVPASVESLLINKAQILVAAMEEMAENRLLHGDGVKTPGAVKLTTAVKELESFVKQWGVDRLWTRDKLEQLVMGILHLDRGSRLAPSPTTTDNN